MIILDDATNNITEFPVVGGKRVMPVKVQESVLPDGASTSNNQTNGAQKTQIVDSDGTSVDVKTNIHTGTKEIATVTENHICAGNTTDVALGPNANFAGSWQDATNYNEIRISVIADQNSTTDGLEIQWSDNGTDMVVGVEDNYSIIANKGKSFSTPVNWPYFRVKYTNGSVAQSSFYLISQVCRMASKGSSHRIKDSIVGDDDAILAKVVQTGEDDDGVFRNIKATKNGRQKISISDAYGFEVENTPMDELRMVTPVKLVGATFSGTTIDPNFWTVTNANGGSSTQANGQITVSTNTTASGSSQVQSVRFGRYTGGSSNRWRAVIQLGDTGTSGNSRKWGMFNGTDGAYFEIDGTTIYAVTLKTSTPTRVASASWNGDTVIPTLTNANTYEIYITNSKVYFVLNGVLKHTHLATTTTWADHISLPAKISNTNTAISTNQTITCRVMTIYRLGNISTQPTFYFQQGTTAGIVLKYGTGNVHGMIISAVTNNATVILYDNTAASGTLLWSSGAMGAQTQPFDLEMHDVSFANGLTLAITGANCNVYIAYE